MGAPAWRHLDLLPVVARRGNDDEEGDDEARDTGFSSTVSENLKQGCALLDLFEGRKRTPHQARSSM